LSGRLRLIAPPEVRNKCTIGSKDRLLSGLAEGYDIDRIDHRVWNSGEFWKISVNISKRGIAQEEIVSLNEPDFIEHINHYKDVPIPGTSTAQLIFLENPNEYEETTEQFWTFLSGRAKAIIRAQTIPVPAGLVLRVRRKILAWIDLEGKIRVPGNRAPRLFIDSCLIFVTHNDVEITTVAREFLDTHELELLRRQTRFKVFLFSPLWLSPKYPKDREKRTGFFFELDPLFGFSLLDVQERDLVCFGVRTIRQCLAEYGKPWRNDVSTFVRRMFEDSFTDTGSHTQLAPPALNSEYTAIPWITFAAVNPDFQNELKELSDCYLTIPEFLTVAYPGLPGEYNSFRFAKRAQRAAVNMRSLCSGEELNYNLRFDMSPMPTLHVDYQIHAPGHMLHLSKPLEHEPVDLDNLWALNRNLYLGFLAAGGYDTFFDHIIENRLAGFRSVTRSNAATAYPLILRVHTRPKEDWLRANPQIQSVLLKIAAEGLDSLSTEEKRLIPELVSQELFLDGRLTLYGEILATRFRP
jgi:hypothetical protein